MKHSPLRILVLSVFLGAFFFVSGTAFGQHQVSGTVTDSVEATPLPGTNVVVAGTTTGTTTGGEGQFQLTAPSPRDTLIISFVGYETKEVPIRGRNTINVSLAPSTLSGQELVVVGYTEQQDETISGAVSSISSEEIASRGKGTLEDALKGRIAGVNIESTGNPGAGASVTIRGSSFLGNNSPLYVVDGVYTGQNPNLNPNAIESIRVLKDASAAAQYGAQAANGVIVIETKSGSPAEGPSVSLSSYYGYQEIPNRIDVMDTEQWAEFNRRAHENAGLQPGYSARNPDEFANTDWQEAILKVGAVQEHSLGVSGGGETGTYRISGSVYDQEGTVIGTEYRRYTARVNSEIQRGPFTFGENATFVYSEKNQLDTEQGTPLILSIQQLPTVPVRDESNPGGFGLGGPQNQTLVFNPVATQKLHDDDNYYSRALGNLYAEVDILDNLNFRTNFGLEYSYLRNEHFRAFGQVRQNEPLDPAWYEVTEENFARIQFENLLTYNDTLGTNHHVNTVVGYREEREDFQNLVAYREGYSVPSLRTIAAGSQNPQTGGTETTATLRSYFVRANYDYAGRYLFTGTFRRDGSSRFGANNRFGNFYAGSMGWILSEESFYEDLPVLGDHVNLFKLRGSYGRLGNQDIAPYATSATVALNQSYVFGPTGRLATGAIQLTLNNPNLRWQENIQTNFGVDLELFNGTISANANYYISESEGLLVQAPLPNSLGSAGNPYVNAGSIQNSGLELGLGYNDTFGDLQFNVNANVTTVNNEVQSLGRQNQPIFAGTFSVSRTAVGAPIGHFYVLQTDGLFQSEEEVQNHTSSVDGQEVVIQPNAQPGDIRFADLNGDGQISNQDRYVAGSPYPDFEGGLSVDASYQGFDLSVSVRGKYGNELFNVPKYWTRPGATNNYRESADPWTPNNRDTDTPRLITETPQASQNNATNTDRWIEDASYLRIQNLELGYTLPSRFLVQSIGAPEGTSFRVYASAENLYTLTGYSNWDPATPGQEALAGGVDDGSIYPSARTITVGLNLNI